MHNLERYLGKPKYLRNLEELQDEVGKVTGMAWTSVGGETLNIEVNTFPGKSELLLTGQLGDVMKESARLDLAMCAASAAIWALTLNFLKKQHSHSYSGRRYAKGRSFCRDFHGDSGDFGHHQTTCTQRVCHDRRTDPAGQGAAGGRHSRKKSAGCPSGRLHKIILPQENRKDIEEIPADIQKELQFYPVQNLQQVLDLALVEA